METDYDPANCGSCAKVCAQGQVCSAGACALQCAGGTTLCANACVDTKTNPAHCGGCSKPCVQGQVCSNGACALQCAGGTTLCSNLCVDIKNDPANCGGCAKACGNDQYCTASACKTIPVGYEPVGPQQSVPVLTVTNGGWAQCYKAYYNASGTALSTVLAACNRSKLMLACRPTNSATLALLAWAPRVEVIFDTGNNYTDTNTANGAAWYYYTSRSWGFAREAETVYKNSCDTNSGTYPQLRLCWHTSANNMSGGWRCGSTIDLNASTAWEKIVYHKD
ncbi:MAG: hypothetical protein HY744_05205 [Deltaproteobacteria bacterium]|nr:hypothetical protein [Deltaproteobacteria bacterium]